MLTIYNARSDALSPRHIHHYFITIQLMGDCEIHNDLRTCSQYNPLFVIFQDTQTTYQTLRVCPLEG